MISMTVSSGNTEENIKMSGGIMRDEKFTIIAVSVAEAGENEQ